MDLSDIKSVCNIFLNSRPLQIFNGLLANRRFQLYVNHWTVLSFENKLTVQ